jgi:MFS family permease
MIAYGSVRLWGSIGYAVMAYLIGQLFGKGFPTSILYPVYAVFAVANIILAFFMKEDAVVGKRVPIKEMKVGVLFKNYYFLTFLIFILLAYIPISASNNYFVNVVTNLGGTSETAGTVFALRALAEIPFFALSQRFLRKMGTRAVLILSIFSYCGIYICYGFATKLGLVLFAHILQGPTYGLLLTAMLSYVFELSPINLRTTGQTLLNATQTGLASMIGNSLMGRLMDILGVEITYRYAAVAVSAAILVFFITLWVGKKLNIPLVPEQKQAEAKVPV